MPFWEVLLVRSSKTNECTCMHHRYISKMHTCRRLLWRSTPRDWLGNRRAKKLRTHKRQLFCLLAFGMWMGARDALDLKIVEPSRIPTRIPTH